MASCRWRSSIHASDVSSSCFTASCKHISSRFVTCVTDSQSAEGVRKLGGCGGVLSCRVRAYRGAAMKRGGCARKFTPLAIRRSRVAPEWTHEGYEASGGTKFASVKLLHRRAIAPRPPSYAALSPPPQPICMLQVNRRHLASSAPSGGTPQLCSRSGIATPEQLAGFHRVMGASQRE